MRKLLTILILIVASINSISQDVVGSRVIAKQSFFLKDRWIDSIRIDTVGLSGDNGSLMTAGAIYKFVAGRMGGGIADTATIFPLLTWERTLANTLGIGDTYYTPTLYKNLSIDMSGKFFFLENLNDFAVNLNTNEWAISGSNGGGNTVTIISNDVSNRLSIISGFSSTRKSEMIILPDSVRWNIGGNGTLNMDSIRSGASYGVNKLIGWRDNNGVVGYVGVGDGLDLTAGVLSATGGGGSAQDTVYRIMTEGQSNNLGVGFVADLTNLPIYNDNYSFTIEQSRVYIFNPQTGIYEKLYVPNNNQAANNPYYTAGGGSTAPAFGPELGIAQRWMQGTSPGDTLFIDKNTVDGGAIAAFQEGTDYYDTILARRVIANAWLAARGKFIIDIGYHWVQGEGDMGSSEASYLASLETLIDDRVADDLIDTLNGIVVLAQINTASANYGAGVAAAKLSYAASNPSFTRITTYTDNFNDDDIHLNAVGQLQLGYDGYQQILQTVSKAVGDAPSYYPIILLDSTSTSIPLNLKGYWAMEETSGDVLDGTGNGFDLTRVNGVSSVSGKIALGSGFVGASVQRLEGSNSNDLSAGVGLTVAAWVKINGSAAAEFLVSKYDATNTEYILYWNSANEFRFAMSDNGVYQAGHDIVSSTGGSFTPGTWHYVVGVWTGTTMVLYVDNVARASTGLASSFLGTADFTIGDATPTVWPSTADIDEVMVWDIALSTDELTYWYNSGVGRTLSDITSTTYGVVNESSSTILEVPNLKVVGSTYLGASATANSTLQVGGSFSTAYAATATSMTLDETNYTVKVTATGQTITLPSAVGITGRIYTIKLTASGSATVASSLSQNIDASTTYSLASQYKYVTVQSDGANWIVIANN